MQTLVDMQTPFSLQLCRHGITFLKQLDQQIRLSQLNTLLPLVHIKFLNITSVVIYWITFHIHALEQTVAH